MKLFSWRKAMVRLAPMIVLPTFLFLTGCASSDVVTEDSAVKTQSTVPGEKSADEPMGAPAGPGGAGVKW